MSKRKPIEEAQIDRRIEFLIKEANSDTPFKDQTVTFALRVITNFLAVNDDVQSRKLSRNCKYRSKEAHKLFLSNPDGWLDEVTNEHQYPIKRAWDWIYDNRAVLTVDLVKDHLKKWPIVVVTKKKNKTLKDDPNIPPDRRYLNAGIEVLKKNGSGEWEPVSTREISN